MKKMILLPVEAALVALSVMAGLTWAVADTLKGMHDSLEAWLLRREGPERLDAEDRLRKAVNEANHAERFSVSDAEYRRIMAERERRAQRPAGCPSEILP